MLKAALLENLLPLLLIFFLFAKIQVWIIFVAFAAAKTLPYCNSF